MPLTCARAASTVAKAVWAPVVVEISIAATDSNELALLAAVNTVVSALATAIVPTPLVKAIVPVLTAATVPASVNVVPANDTESLPAVLLAKVPIPMLRPSNVLRVMLDLLPAVVKFAVMPVVDCCPLMADTSEDKSL